MFIVLNVLAECFHSMWGQIILSYVEMLHLQAHLKEQLKQYDEFRVTEPTVVQSNSSKLLVIDELIEDRLNAMVCTEIDVLKIDEISIVCTSEILSN